ncbi:MAG TPA: DNA methyltransferase, partial [Chthoniobacterales bacterium]|nr:DNA methyltransferase [Chthoniobacterales bacterium]
DPQDGKTKKNNPENLVNTVRKKLTALHDKIVSITVLDPACGSGNFLYVALQLLLDLEKELITFATQLGFKIEPRVSVQQLKAIELNAYAFELAQVSVQIGYLKWRRDNGFGNDKDPVLQNLESFQNEDALLVPHFRSKAKSLKEAQAGEHGSDDALKFYTERKWPVADAIVGNPPFLGIAFMRSELSDEYVDALFNCFNSRIARGSDLCCYWFEKARDLIAHKNCKRVGLLATQGIRGGASRDVLKRIKQSGDIFFAISDRGWTLDGANVHVSMIGFDDGSEATRMLDDHPVASINANLTAAVADTTFAVALEENAGICFMGPSAKAPFDIPDAIAISLLASPNAHGAADSDVVRRVQSAVDLTKRDRWKWTIDFGSKPHAEAIQYEQPFAYVEQHVFPVRSTNRRQTNLEWWQYERPRIDMRSALAPLLRFIATPGVAKHRLYVWRTAETLCNQGTLVFARDDDYFFGVLHSRFHEVWARAQGTQLRERESGFRYTPTTCFETFPFPTPTSEQEQAIAAAATELNELRENWLNPPEWATTRVLEFPGSIEGPWSRFVHDADVRGIGSVRYPRIEPRDQECAKKLVKRTLTSLYNERPAWLAHAHAKLDAAVAAAYGFAIDLRDEAILEKLLALNHERAEAESRQASNRNAPPSRAKRSDEML